MDPLPPPDPDPLPELSLEGDVEGVSTTS